MPDRIPSGRQRASVSLRAGRHARLTLAAELSTGGLLAIGALVSAILLSTAALVHVARRHQS